MTISPRFHLARRAAAPLAAALFSLLLAACGSTPRTPESRAGESSPSSTASAPTRGGGYYKDDGPGNNPPPNLDRIPDAVPRAEPLHRFANRPYSVFGERYVPATSVRPFRQRGVASWYGRRFHGKPTSSGEIYDMYAMTAAHPTLPIPSYARVTSVANGRSVVVRVNDRGPFLRGRVMDLSYAAAHRLGYINAGHAEVEVELIVPGGGQSIIAASTDTPAAPAVARNEPVAMLPGQGVFLQVGVFSSRTNAEDLRGRIMREMASMADRVQLFADGERFRLQVGPWHSESEARGVAEQIHRVLDLQPFVVVR
ncbi:septal ring lytic transglycosylase RlpA family protein [Pseudothauera nasutitermitis]|uniref:Endolytic peptidoglycan transglycosylase RlpA n=1 Tax=Pseudothauera nasutitermitis TaxID=2565930 RepID=A0A4S4B179_9RHOO|nr:septal ring lytic transglycosylase RlpA family protein [Pseudothauera nasutitermitis]THF64648.1 septal ring lytic transglycosylase RlpA family protein [Pseudothauera nasutitermitis]